MSQWDANGSGEEPGRRGASLLERPRVLLVEDDAAVSGALVELLGAHYSVRLAEDGEQALELARAGVADVVVLDRFLPRLDGLGVLEALQRDARTRELPVLLLSGDRDEETVVRSLELGAADFVRKPASPRELVARIERSLRAARQQRQLQSLARTDALTGLANFRTLTDRLEEEFKRAQRYHYPLAAMMVDLDHLKSINDTWGHDVGNRAILALARHLRANLREVDFAARFGGDEFVILLPHQTAAEAAILAERVRAGLRDLRVRTSGGETGRELALTVSVGVADHSEGAPRASADALLKAADAALYQAKVAGRDRLVVALPETRGQAPACSQARH